jgi:hypothetical protein
MSITSFINNNYYIQASNKDESCLIASLPVELCFDIICRASDAPRSEAHTILPMAISLARVCKVFRQLSNDAVCVQRRLDALSIVVMGTYDLNVYWRMIVPVLKQVHLDVRLHKIVTAFRKIICDPHSTHEAVREFYQSLPSILQNVFRQICWNINGATDVDPVTGNDTGDFGTHVIASDLRCPQAIESSRLMLNQYDYLSQLHAALHRDY